MSEYLNKQEITLSENMAEYMGRITIDRGNYYAGLYLSIEDIYEIYSDSDMIDKEILDFIDTLTEYAPNDIDPIEKEEFGDPERLELKSLLRNYKRVYPDANNIGVMKCVAVKCSAFRLNKMLNYI